GVRAADCEVPRLRRTDLSQVPFGAGRDVSIVRNKRRLRDAVAFGKFNSTVATKRREHRLYLVFGYLDDVNVEMAQLLSMLRSMRLQALFKIGIRQVRLGLYEDPARNIVILSRLDRRDSGKKEKN